MKGRKWYSLKKKLQPFITGMPNYAWKSFVVLREKNTKEKVLVW